MSIRPAAKLPHAPRLTVAPLDDELAPEWERLAQRSRLAELAQRLAVEQPPYHERPEDATPGEQPRATVVGVELDAPLDVLWAHESPLFDGVLHLFAQEWHGIRAGAGYLPGRKLAVTALRPLSRGERSVAVEHCLATDVRTVVIHGWSPQMEELASIVRRLGGRKPQVQLIWYGTTAQFHVPAELAALCSVLQMKRKGILTRLGAVKPGFHLISTDFEPRLLLSVPPRLRAPATQPRKSSGNALLPLPNDWRKNWYTNLIAAAAEPRLRTIHVTQGTTPPREFRLRPRIVSRPRPSRWELFRLLPSMDVVLNASLSECQPLTALEALAHGVPCVTGPLDLGALDRHPLQRASQVMAPDSLSAVRSAIGRLLDLGRAKGNELAGMMADYQAVLIPEAFKQMGEFFQ